MIFRYGLILSAVFSLNVFANEYQHYTVQCQITGNHTSISTAKNEALPKPVNFEVDMVKIVSKEKVVKAKMSGTNLVSLKWLKADYCNGVPCYNIKFDRLDHIQSKNLLEALGAKDVPALPRGFSFKKIHFAPGVMAGWQVSQIHFPVDQLDGSSYHAKIYCRASDNGY